MDYSTMAAGREMDAMVAEKVMGETLSGYINLKGDPIAISRDDLYTIPRYSTDISAAWQIIENLQSRGYHFDIRYPWDGWRVQCWLPGSSPYVCAYNCADTVPLAICRAALLAVTAPIAARREVG